jgi:DNA-binding winged helix-turn-helix (wHTH) protein/TolB-like protein/Flp pilus assembly protein TadD
VLPLAGRAFDVLEYLLRHRDRVVGKEELLSAVWPRVVVEENNLNQAVSAIRRALGDSRDAPQFVATLPGRGYRFVAAVDEDVKADIADTAPLASPAPASARNRRRLIAGLGALGAASLVGAGAWWAWPQRRSVRGSPPKSIAVLPFQPIAAGASDAMLELGITETLINRLSVIPDLTVTPLTSVRRYTSADRDPLAAGRELGVEGVLDGALQFNEERVRVTARLLEVSTGAALSSNTFDERGANLLDVQDALARRVVDALEIDLRGPSGESFRKRATDDPVAWRTYAHGRYLAERRDEEGLRRALELFSAAERRDPRFALAAAGIADTWALLGIFGLEPTARAGVEARAAAERAIALDGELVEGPAALGHVLMIYAREWARAQDLIRRALELKPTFAQGHVWLAMLATFAGRHGESLRHMELARAFEPKSLSFSALNGFLLHFAGRLAEAREELESVVEAEPRAPLPRHFLARVLIAMGDGAAALRAIDGVTDPGPGSYSNAGRALALLGRAREARTELARAFALGKQGFGVGYDLALLHIALGERDAALGAIERALDPPSIMIGYLNSEPGFASLRDEPRFRAFSRRIGLG